MRSERQVLLVEDSPSDVRLFKEAIREWKTPACVHVAGDGDRAIDFLRQDDAPELDLIVLKMNLPRLSGLDVLRWIRTRTQLKSVPVIVMSSSSLPSELRSASECGATAWLQKATDLDEFYKNVAGIESCCSAVSHAAPGRLRN